MNDVRYKRSRVNIKYLCIRVASVMRTDFSNEEATEEISSSGEQPA